MTGLFTPRGRLLTRYTIDMLLPYACAKAVNFRRSGG
jgi:hypothetical protein